MESETEPESHAYSLDMQDADVTFYPDFFPETEADALFAALIDTIAWRQETIRIYGKEIDQPRLIAWYGDAEKSYTYSGLTLSPTHWTPELIAIRRKVEAVAGVCFNSVLLNQYRSERDSVSWHSDDESELGIDPIIASVSFGAARKFQFKHKTNLDLRREIVLTHGSLLLMRGATQHHWKHQIPKSSKPHGPRINLTFRIIR